MCLASFLNNFFAYSRIRTYVVFKEGAYEAHAIVHSAIYALSCVISKAQAVAQAENFALIRGWSEEKDTCTDG